MSQPSPPSPSAATPTAAPAAATATPTAARAAAADCVFCRIVAGQIPSRRVHEDDELLAFHDIQPWAPVHVLVIPKAHIRSLDDTGAADAPLLGRMMALAVRLLRELGVTNGHRVLVNTGADGRQEVPHLHLHAIGGPRPWTRG